jgi:putative membrane protein
MLRQSGEMDMMYGNGWSMGWMWIFWVAILVGLVLLIGWMMTAGRTRRGGSKEPAEKSAEEILKQRYARGEVDREEYAQKIHDLRA